MNSEPSPDGALATSQLARRLRAGDERALEECYREYGPLVRNFLRRFVGVDEADDLLQQVFLEFWRAHRRLDPSHSPAALLLAIARRRAIDHLRRRRHVVVDVESVRDLVGDHGDEVIDRLVWSSEVRQALALLSPDQRECLELAYLGGLSQREVADRLGIPLGTVKARTARALRRLAERIEEVRD